MKQVEFCRNPFGVFKNYASVVQVASQPSKATSKATSQTSSESTGLPGFEVFFLYVNICIHPDFSKM